jgi:hypothetical protein
MWITIAGGVLLLVMGYQIRYKRRYSLIAGYDPRRTSRPDAIADLFGGILLIAGASLVIVGIATRVLPTAPWGVVAATIAVGQLVAIVVGSVIIARRSKDSRDGA